MPKLLIFAACEKVLIDQLNNLSLITVLQEAKVGMPPPVVQAQLPAGAKLMAPMKWDAITLWAKTDDKAYEQRVALFDPSGNSTGIDTTGELDFQGKATLRHIVTVLGLPSYEMGVYLLKLWVREKGQEFGEPIAEFPITLSREEPKSP
jgi:hypothetical protein